MYSRFKALQNHSEQDQKKLQNSTAAVIGLGATGSNTAENLARHGVNLIIIDRDYLEEKDSYSSGIYTLEQCEKALPKAVAAEEKLSELTEVKSHAESLSPENIDRIASADIILDGTDNLETRQVINDFSKKEDIPWVYTAAIAEKGYSMLLEEKCFNCMVRRPEKVATCETDGIMREIAQITAAKSSLKAVKYITNENTGEELEIVPEGRKLDVETSGCSVCRNENFPHLSEPDATVRVCGEGKYQFEKELNKDAISNAVESGEKLVENDYLVRIKYEGFELSFFRSGRVIAEGRSKGHAESLISEAAGI